MIIQNNILTKILGLDNSFVYPNHDCIPQPYNFSNFYNWSFNLKLLSLKPDV